MSRTSSRACESTVCTASRLLIAKRFAFVRVRVVVRAEVVNLLLADFRRSDLPLLRILVHEEIAARYILSRNPQLAQIVTMALESGMRKAELMGLTWDRVDLSRG